MIKSLRSESLDNCIQTKAYEGDKSNPFIDISDETALLAAAQLVETAAFNLATRLSAEDTAELVDVSARLSSVVERLPGGLTKMLKRH